MERLYSTSEIAFILNKAPESVSYANWKYFHMSPVKVDHGNHIWSSAQFETFKKYFENSETGKRLPSKVLEEIKKDIPEDDMAALHPLVTDKRFLRTSFFPTLEEITPLCYQEK